MLVGAGVRGEGGAVVPWTIEGRGGTQPPTPAAFFGELVIREEIKIICTTSQGLHVRIVASVDP